MFSVRGREGRRRAGDKGVQSTRIFDNLVTRLLKAAMRLLLAEQCTLKVDGSGWGREQPARPKTDRNQVTMMWSGAGVVAVADLLRPCDALVCVL